MQSATDEGLLEFRGIIQSASDRVEGSARLFIWLFFCFRGILIVLGACIAAGSGGKLPGIGNWIPWMAIVVVVVTAFDALIRPGEKYKAHQFYLTDLRTFGLEMLQDNRDINGIRQRFIDAQKRFDGSLSFV